MLFANKKQKKKQEEPLVSYTEQQIQTALINNNLHQVEILAESAEIVREKNSLDVLTRLMAELAPHIIAGAKDGQRQGTVYVSSEMFAEFSRITRAHLRLLERKGYTISKSTDPSNLYVTWEF